MRAPVLSTLVTFTLTLSSAMAFPDGAPIDACVKPKKVNQPNHDQAKPQPQDKNPYQIVASDVNYGPGSQITVTIEGSEHFKGFLIQARDIDTNQWIGSWEEIPNTKVHPECSAITHADPKYKEKAVLIWTAPKHTNGGQVYFTGTVLKNYKTFWSDMINLIPQ